MWRCCTTTIQCALRGRVFNVRFVATESPSTAQSDNTEDEVPLDATVGVPSRRRELAYAQPELTLIPPPPRFFPQLPPSTVLQHTKWQQPKGKKKTGPNEAPRDSTKEKTPQK